MRSTVRNGVALFAAAIIPVIAVPAQADAATSGAMKPSGILSCPGDGEITAFDRCTTLSNGILLINNGETAAHVEYDKTGGSSISARLGYESGGTNHYASYETMTTSGEIYQEDFSFSANCSTHEGLLNQSTGSLFTTPPADSC
ncbi:hypothetical protein POF50_031745 [Streptomyces sp. SL13]|jgi:hypothetical protein|uniref:Uncharacterized protein n=1 Tax=Streptantibioticus silvisoli TaxID=2705255 RepID=A0AA90H4B1_9ACTN|nr:hypothetical protein [Streptantibioticus silvisoli]MDI5966855.1 hypothetical protein [Streptantibioticus silvisoli]MDI5973863.1 hypothetical protein [Streptantibioticus silvisoli]